ncbi:Helix-turn-helix domain-containing protein [Gammaproteobacteria bacterium]
MPGLVKATEPTSTPLNHMKTLSVTQAAELLHASPVTVRALARAHEIPATKVGKGWLFVEEDLLEWVRSRYGNQARTAVTQTERRETCSTVVPIRPTGGSVSRIQVAAKYDSLLAPKTGKTPKNTKQN